MKFADIFNQKQTSNATQCNRAQSILEKAESLAIVATLVDFTAVDNKILENYIWTLSDLIQEAKTLYSSYPFD